MLPLAPGHWRDPEHLEAQMRTLLASARGRVARLTASVPLCHGFLRLIDLPADTEDVGDALRWDMSRYLARPVDLYALDWQASRRQAPEGSQTWLTAAFRRTELGTLRSAAAAVSPAPLEAVDLDATALINAFTANYPEFKDDDTCLIKADHHATTCVRTQGGDFAGAAVRRHHVNAPAGDDPQERAESLLQRAQSVVEDLNACARGEGNPDRILLCGDLTSDPDFRDLVKVRSPVPCTLLNPYRNLAAPDPTEFSHAHPGAPFAVVVGMALRLTEEPR